MQNDVSIPLSMPTEKKYKRTNNARPQLFARKSRTHAPHDIVENSNVLIWPLNLYSTTSVLSELQNLNATAIPDFSKYSSLLVEKKQGFGS